MSWLWYVLLIAAMLGSAFLNLLSLPGNWLMIAGAGVYAWLTRGRYVGLWTLVILALLAGAAELIEFAAGSAGARKAGWSRRAAWGALIGGIAGAILFNIPVPIIGTIIGLCLGVFIGAWLAEYTVEGHFHRSLQVGYGATKGRLIGIAAKVACSGIILGVVILKGAPVHSAKALPAQPPATLPAISDVLGIDASRSVL